MKHAGAKFLLLSLLAGSLAVGWMVQQQLEQQNAPKKSRGVKKAVPVEVVEIRQGGIELRRTFSGTLEAGAKLLVSSKVGGRVMRVHVNLADQVTRDDLIVVLDSAEFVQQEKRALAELEVAKANRDKAIIDLNTARRELRRIEELQGRGVSSESQFDLAMAGQLAAQAELAVANAEVVSAEASMETARIQLGYTQVKAQWHGGSEQRVVAERFVQEGDAVAAQTPLMSIVDLNPLIGVIYVTEKEYARFVRNQPVSLSTDAWPEEVFGGRVARIAPVFQPESRQARIELEIDNPRFRLKPGMFIRVTVALERRQNATLVPVSALVDRDDQTGVFVLNAAGDAVHWRLVKTGILQDDQVEISGDGLEGRVVVLGQQFLGEGSLVVVPENFAQDAVPSKSAESSQIKAKSAR